MKLQYLGTAAAEGVPALFCRCAFCQYARRAGGREIRTRAGAMLDHKIKLDFGPDSYKHELDFGLDYAAVHSVLITHTHEDHLDVEDIAHRRPTSAHFPEGEPPMIVYGSEAVGEKLARIHSPWLAFQRVKPFEPVDVEGYRVTALEAVHHINGADPSRWPVVHEGKTYGRWEEAFFYLIEKDGRSLLYAHDTDEFTPADMAFLAGRAVDLISLDCTNGRLDLSYVGHMGATENKRMRERLLANGAADGHTVFVANHFSHNGLLPYGELQALLPDFLIAYDGMTVEI
ncbi:MAG: hypothetical protein IJ048_02940 [Clostridia bacterium]|nr:hypothetical protein [Clostridia bacterium]